MAENRRRAWRVGGGILVTLGLLAVTLGLIPRIDCAERWWFIDRSAMRAGLWSAAIVAFLFLGYGVLNVLYLTTEWGERRRGLTRTWGCLSASLGLIGWFWIFMWLLRLCID